VDIQETIKLIDDIRRLGADVFSGDELEALNTAIEILERTRWISVSERLPDGDVASVMIYTESGGVAEGQYYPTIKAWKQFRWSVENANVTHWMPLPEPPEMTEREEAGHWMELRL